MCVGAGGVRGWEVGGSPTFRFPKLGKLSEFGCTSVVSLDIRKRIATSEHTENSMNWDYSEPHRMCSPSLLRADA